jgi:predicted transcriptional regulator
MVYNVPARTLSAKILVYLSENPGATLKDLSQVFNISMNTLRNMIYRLRNNGYVEKAGNGYVLTSKGEWFVEKVLKSRETSHESITEEKHVEAPGREAAREASTSESMVKEEQYSGEEEGVVEEKPPSRDTVEDTGDLLKRIEMLETTLNELREKLEEVSSEIKRLKEQVVRGSKSRVRRKKEEVEKLPKPVMNIREALNTLGPLLDQLRLEGRVEIIGSIVVDREFYEEFKKKFPLPVKEAENLSPMEKTLLNEMIKDARVIKHAGREYRIV